jgi:hypothetical protein
MSTNKLLLPWSLPETDRVGEAREERKSQVSWRDAHKRSPHAFGEQTRTACGGSWELTRQTKEQFTFFEIVASEDGALREEDRR